MNFLGYKKLLFVLEMEVEILKDIIFIVLLYLILRHVSHKVIDKANYYKLRACLYLKFT